MLRVPPQPAQAFELSGEIQVPAPTTHATDSREGIILLLEKKQLPH